MEGWRKERGGGAVVQALAQSRRVRVEAAEAEAVVRVVPAVRVAVVMVVAVRAAVVRAAVVRVAARTVDDMLVAMAVVAEVAAVRVAVAPGPSRRWPPS